MVVVEEAWFKIFYDDCDSCDMTEDEVNSYRSVFLLRHPEVATFVPLVADNVQVKQIKVKNKRVKSNIKLPNEVKKKQQKLKENKSKKEIVDIKSSKIQKNECN